MRVKVARIGMARDAVMMLVVVLVALLMHAAAQLETESQAGAATRAEEMNALLAFKRSSDREEKLGSWTFGSGPCSGGDNVSQPTWSGVECIKGHVSKLVLEDQGLVGGVEPLLALKSLRVLSLKNNALSGALPTNLSNWRILRFVFLSGNRFNGSISASFALLTRLWRLDLSDNLLTGPVPPAFNSLTGILTLRLENNGLSQALPPLENLTMLVDFNVSSNRLRGVIPKSLTRFNASAFAGNQDLCGLPLDTRCNQVLDDLAPAPAPSTSSSHNNNSNSNRNPLVSGSNPSNSSSLPGSKSARAPRSSNRLSTGAIIAIVVGDTVVLFVMTFMFLVYYWNRYHSRDDSASAQARTFPESSKSHKNLEEDYCARASAASSAAIVGSNSTNRLVFLGSSGSGFKAFDLEDLLRASAEMLGKGSLGSAYKAMLEDGCVVAVKRLKDVTSSSRKEFEQHMELIARLRHPHLVQLHAFYYAKDEKLLVYDYMPNGSLHTLLHGNRGPGRVPVDWTTRVKIALGAAKGLAYIHHEGGSHKLPHGNVKSSNILLDKDGGACVGDFGLALLMNTAACCRLVGYRAPEHTETRRISQKGDVYSFGVLLLEILTGKSPVDQSGMGVDLPKWVQSVVREEWTAEVFDLELMRYKNIEEEMVQLLQIAISCVAHAPDARPKMAHVVKMIEEIRGDISPARDESFDSQSNSSYLSEDAQTN